MVICLYGEKEFVVKEIRKSFLFCNFERLLTFSFTVPFKITHKNLNLIRRILFNEAKKVFPQYKEVPYGFHLSGDESNRLRCYVVDPEEFNYFMDILLAKRILPERIYPFFAALYAYTLRYEGKNKLVVFVNDSSWYLCAFQGKDMVFQRSIRGEVGDIQGFFSQLEVVLAHLVQQLRFRPDRIFFLGEKLPMPVTLSIPSVVERVSLNALLKAVCREGNLSDYAIQLPTLEAQWKSMKIFKRAAIACLILFGFFSSYGYLKLRQLQRDAFELEAVRSSVLRIWADVEEGLRLFKEEGLGDWFELLKLRASVPDTRRMLAQLGFLSEVDGLRLEKVILKPQERVLLLEGELPLQDFRKRQKAFSLLLELSKRKGMEVKAVEWDLIEGNFKLELTVSP